MDLNMNYFTMTSGTSTSTCLHPEHNPPVAELSELYSHRCPGCGYGFTLYVRRQT